MVEKTCLTLDQLQTSSSISLGRCMPQLAELNLNCVLCTRRNIYGQNTRARSTV